MLSFNSKEKKNKKKPEHQFEMELINFDKKIIPTEEIDYHRYYQIIKNKSNYSKPKFKQFNKYIYTSQEKQKIKQLMLSKKFSIHRKNFWLHASGAITAMQNNKTLYHDLINNIPSTVPSTYKKLILPDLTRTFPTEPFFQEKENLSKIERILLAYSWRNSTIGYCQGFNFIVGRLLEFIGNEEETFWLFAQVIESILPVEHYAELSGVMCDCVILLPFFKTSLKNVYEHLEKLNFTICINNLLYKWFVSLFVEGMHSDIWMTIWDLMFLEGNIVLFKAALTIVHLVENKILSYNSILEVNQFFEEQLLYFTHKDFLKEMIQRNFNFDDKYIQMKRNENLPKTFENIKMTNQFKIKQYKQMEKEGKVECNEEWPICVEGLSYFAIDSCFVFRRMEEVVIKENFYNEEENVEEIVRREEEKEERELKELYARESKNKVKKELYKKMIIERRVHKCKNLKREIGNEMNSSINVIKGYLEDKRDFDPKKIIEDLDRNNEVLNREDFVIRNSISVFQKMKEEGSWDNTNGFEEEEISKYYG